MQQNKYDYIFLGAGCASLSILMRMIDSKQFDQKKILLIDKEFKNKNDRTWCFWEKENGFFENLVYKKWNQLLFKSTGESFILDMDGYEYKMIRGIDFYESCFKTINLQKNIDVVFQQISFEQTESQQAKIKLGNHPITVDNNTVIFNSIYNPTPNQKGKFYLLQHFKGWIVETPEDFFENSHATLMDFRVDQAQGTTFVYVLPLSSTKALIEYTLFSEKLLSEREYDFALKNYIRQFLEIENYKVVEQEFGIIPMTNASFSFFKNGMYHIGTAGGQTKASTGYTFRFIQNQSDDIVQQLISKKTPLRAKQISNRFFFYDSTLLNILSGKRLVGKTIFSILFKRNNAKKIFKFLDNETSIKEEINLLNTLPKKIFLKAGFKEFVKMWLSRYK